MVRTPVIGQEGLSPMAEKFLHRNEWEVVMFGGRQKMLGCWWSILELRKSR